MASTKLTRTNGTSTNLKKWTWSAWIKRGIIGTQETFAVSRYDDSNYSRIRTDPDVLQFEDRFSSVTRTDIKSNEKFRDPNAWMHVVVRIDYTQSSAADRARMYVNGTEVTYATTTRQSQDGNSYFNESVPHALGHYNDNNYFHGCMSHVHFTDGYSYAPTEFGETDSTTGQWKIKTSPSVTYGNNGYFVLKDGNGVTDQSGNSNNFTVGSGTLTQTEDNPSNNFAKFNPLFRHGQTTSDSKDFFENAHTTFYTPDSNNARKGFFVSSLGMSSGKYYCEMKIKAGARLFVGICNMNVLKSTSVPYDLTNQSFIGYYPLDGNVKYDSDSTYATSVTTPENNILGFALDMDNSHWYIHKNGTYINSGDPTSGSTGTGSIIGNITSGSSYFNHGEMFFMAADFSTTGYARVEYNFGNGFFGTTAITSEGTNASGIGKFEYDVPTGYTALSTKGLNE